MSAVVIDVIEKGTVARNFLKQMGIVGFFDRGLTEVVINRPGEIWTQGADGLATSRIAGLHARCLSQARQCANRDEGGQAVHAGSDSSRCPA